MRSYEKIDPYSDQNSMSKNSFTGRNNNAPEGINETSEQIRIQMNSQEERNLNFSSRLY